MLTKNDIEKYFIAEKQESILFFSIGIIAIITAIIFIFYCRNNLYRGLAIPLIVIGILQCIVGFTVYTRSDTDRINMVYAYDMNPNAFKEKELPRMETVNKNFVIYRWCEIVFLVAGIIIFFTYRNNYSITNSWSGNAFILGIGITLFIQAALMLGADYFAEKRAHIYTNKIIEFINKK
jgi:ABC-type xylose transport system permease subunit